jgi:hypothetical protein
VFNTFNISQYGEQGERLEELWTLKPDRNVPIKIITYGVVPDGWRELHPARPLREGSWYAINARQYFKLEMTKEGISNEVLSLSEYLAQATKRMKQ